MECNTSPSRSAGTSMGKIRLSSWRSACPLTRLASELGVALDALGLLRCFAVEHEDHQLRLGRWGGRRAGSGGSGRRSGWRRSGWTAAAATCDLPQAAVERDVLLAIEHECNGRSHSVA